MSFCKKVVTQEELNNSSCLLARENIRSRNVDSLVQSKIRRWKVFKTEGTMLKKIKLDLIILFKLLAGAPLAVTSSVRFRFLSPGKKYLLRALLTLLSRMCSSTVAVLGATDLTRTSVGWKQLRLKFHGDILSTFNGVHD